MARQKTRLSDFIAEGERLTASLANNTGDAPHLEAPRVKLVGILDDLRTLAVQQDLHTANKQQVSQRLQVRMAEGKKLATFLRTGIKEHFGNRNEKLVEFGIQPFRGRKKPSLPPPPPESTAPDDTTPAVD